MLLGVNIDHIATLRQARYSSMLDSHNVEPCILSAAQAAQAGGADSITIHVREDLRHMQKEDARIVRREIALPLNLEMAATQSMLEFALELCPDYVCLVPERREEVTTEGGLDVASRIEELKPLIAQLKANGSQVSMFIDPDLNQVEASKAVGATMIELHTGCFANNLGEQRQVETERLITAAQYAQSIQLEIHAGHGIQLSNLAELASIPHIQELNIGHTIIARALSIGLQSAVREMRSAIDAIAWS